MAKNGTKTGGKDFGPGQSGNPGGRPALPEDIKRVKSLTKIEFDRIANRLIGLNREEMKAFMEAPNTTMLEHMVASVILGASVDGDHLRLNFLLDRLIGKVAEKIEAEHIYKHYVQGLDEPEFIEQARLALEFLERKREQSGNDENQASPLGADHASDPK